jgi:hypothetical protein
MENYIRGLTIPVAVRSKVWVCGRSLTGIVGSWLLTGRGLCVRLSLFQKSPTECGVSECDREASTMRRPSPLRAVAPLEKKMH